MLWQHYVLRRGPEIHPTWEMLYESRTVNLLYITGCGFDVRNQVVMKEFVQSLRESSATIGTAKLLLIGFSGYQLDQPLRDQTAINERVMREMFSELGPPISVVFGSSNSADDVSASAAMRQGLEEVLRHLPGATDVVLDVSSLPRVVYLSLLTGILSSLVPAKAAPNALYAQGVTFQILAAEDAALDSKIQSEDPSNDLIYIPGFSGALQAESFQDWPLVWFPVLGEGKASQLEKVMNQVIPSNAEICPVLPHPSRDPRRADRLLEQYREVLFDTRQTPTVNILLAHEGHPFETYRQLLGAMIRYQKSMSIMGGCRLVVTPLASKLITIGAGLACFEMQPTDRAASYRVAIPYVEPTRYVASVQDMKRSRPEIAALILTGHAYDEGTSTSQA
jgi:hypothetical protein